MIDLGHLFLGLMLIGAWLTLKVCVEGVRKLDALRERQVSLRAGAKACLEEADMEEVRSEALEGAVQELKEEVGHLEVRQKNLERTIQARQQKVKDRSQGRFKVDLSGSGTEGV